MAGLDTNPRNQILDLETGRVTAAGGMAIRSIDVG